MRRSPRSVLRGRQLRLGLFVLLASMMIWATPLSGLVRGATLTDLQGTAPQDAAASDPAGVLPPGRPSGGTSAAGPAASGSVSLRPSIRSSARPPEGRLAATPSAARASAGAPSPSVSPSPSAPARPAPALATDTVSLFGFVCTDPGGADPDRADRVVYTRNAAMADPVEDCRTANSGELSIVVTDPADLTVRYDRVQTGPDGYANAVVPVGRPFVLVLADGHGRVSRERMSPVYRLNARPEQREPISVRIFQVTVAAPGTGATPVMSDAADAETVDGTPVAGTADAQPITIIGMICVSESRAGIYDYLPGADQPALGDEPCRRATIDELEFLLLDNNNPSQLYDDAMTGIDGVAVAEAPVDRPFFVTEFSDDPGVETGLPGGSAAITIPRDLNARLPVVLTVVRNVAPGALDLPAGTMLLSTVVCPPSAEAESLTVLGPAPTFLVRAPGAPVDVPQPGSSPGCEEATGDYEIAPYGDETVEPLVVGDDPGDGALIVPLPATLAVDGTRVFAPYRITETGSGQTATFDIQEGAWTSLRVVLVDRPATPAAGDNGTSAHGGTPGAGPDTTGTEAAAVPGTPAVPTETGAVDPAAGSPATAVATPVPDENESGGLTYSPVRLLWAALAVLAIGIFLIGAWVLRRPGHRWRRRAGL